MKCSDYVANRVKEEVDTVFGVTGGCVINLVDSFHKKGINVIPMHHEQSAAIAADAYARFKGFGVCFGTSGPGTTNLITGTACSYYDSIPVLTIGGQVPRKYLNHRDRQMGFQEVNGVDLFKSITKASMRMNDPSDLEEAIHIAKNGRKGPTFLEIPDDYQRADVSVPMRKTELKAKTNLDLQDLVKRAKKPLVIVGSGARDMELDLEVPFLYTWGVKDKYFSHPFAKGDFGITGSPNGNQLCKESDLILMIGTRMDSHQVPNFNDFSNARKIAVGLDFPHDTERVNVPLDFRLSLRGNNWGGRTENTTNSPIYRLVDEICDKSQEGDVIIPDMGQTGCVVFQRWHPKKDQRLFNGMNHSPMGYSLPGAIGAAIAGRKVTSIIGDGSLMMNLQDLQTIGERKLPIEIYVVNNGGYGMIRQTQNDWKQFLDQGVACNFQVPDIQRLGELFGVNIHEIKLNDTEISPKWKYGEKL